MSLPLTSRLSGLLALLVVAPVLFGGQAMAQNSDPVLERLRASYASLDALRAQFVQTVGDARMEGTIILRGDQYRLETADQVLVTDGTTAWAYTRDDNQVLVNHHVDDVTAFSPSTFFTEYPDRFNVQVRGSQSIAGVRHDILFLTPREQGAYVREVTLFVRATDSLPTRVRVVDGNGTTMLFELRDIERNPRLAADTFRFRAPAGAEIVDLR